MGRREKTNYSIISFLDTRCSCCCYYIVIVIIIVTAKRKRFFPFAESKMFFVPVPLRPSDRVKMQGESTDKGKHTRRTLGKCPKSQSNTWTQHKANTRTNNRQESSYKFALPLCYSFARDNKLKLVLMVMLMQDEHTHV